MAQGYIDLMLKDNTNYVVVFDGQEYQCTSFSQENAILLGNADALESYDFSEGLPFVISCTSYNCIFYSKTAGTYSLKILELSSVKQIDSKYLFNSNVKNGVGNFSISEGAITTASGWYSHAEGYRTMASADYSHAEGQNTVASEDSSHAEGDYTTASGSYSHAEGSNTTASGINSHAEGYNTTASGVYSHAEGLSTIASEYYSHAEGYETIASKNGSHAEGMGTKASSECQHVQGKYNIEDTSNKYADIVGNGTKGYKSTQYSNAATLDWSGNQWFAGNIKVGGTGYDDTNAKSIASDISLTGSTLQLKDANGNLIGTAIELPTSGGGGGLTVAYDSDAESMTIGSTGSATISYDEDAESMSIG